MKRLDVWCPEKIEDKAMNEMKKCRNKCEELMVNYDELNQGSPSFFCRGLDYREISRSGPDAN